MYHNNDKENNNLRALRNPSMTRTMKCPQMQRNNY